MHNLPPGYITSYTAYLLGNFVGKFVDYDTTSIGGSWRSFMQVRVAIDVRLLLKRSKRVVIHGNQSFVV